MLVISAQPDDEVIDAWDKIARHVTDGDGVYWCVVTQGYEVI
jgi:LmbE family N-acetylglucosaminyl deacetylase